MEEKTNINIKNEKGVGLGKQKVKPEDTTIYL
jgi:hypothetical protein